MLFYQPDAQENRSHPCQSSSVATIAGCHPAGNIIIRRLAKKVKFLVHSAFSGARTVALLRRR